MKARADTKGLPAVFCCRTSSDSRPFPLAFLYSFPATSAGATSEIKAGFGKPVCSWPCTPTLSLSQTCRAVLKLPLALHRLRQSPNPPNLGQAGEVMEQRNESRAPRICSPPGAPWLDRITRLCSHRGAFGEGLKRGNYCLHPVTGKASVFC